MRLEYVLYPSLICPVGLVKNQYCVRLASILHASGVRLVSVLHLYGICLVTVLDRAVIG